jgi:L-lactate dehydrogenase complex protein LldG
MSSYLFDQKPPLSEIDAMLIIANSSQVVKDIGNAFKLLRGKYKKNTPHTFFVSGPSKTADVEQKTIVGVHGPSSLFLLLTDNSNYGI